MKYDTLNLVPFITRHHKEPEDRSGAIHPSSLGLCLRGAYWKYQGKKLDLPYTEEDQRRFASGYMVEDYALRAYIYNGSLIASNVPIGGTHKGIPIRGFIDAIVRVDGGWAILDAKSVKPGAFYYGDLPYGHHEVQVGAYALCLSEMMKIVDSDLPAFFKGLVGDESSNFCALITELREGKYGQRKPPVLHYIAKDLSQDEAIPASTDAQAKALMALNWLTGHLKDETLPARPWRSPEEHYFACAKQIQKGYRSKKTGQWTKEPIYVPACNFFLSCWGCQPVQWSFWNEVVQSRQAVKVKVA